METVTVKAAFLEPTFLPKVWKELLVMSSSALLYFLGAAYLSGIGTSVGMFSLIMRTTNSPDRKSCFLRLVTVTCFALASYLLVAGFIGLE